MKFFRKKAKAIWAVVAVLVIISLLILPLLQVLV